MINNYLTFDVEDYFQVSAFEKNIPKENWSDFESRVERNTSIFLNILSEYDLKATFFVLGWVAEKYPNIIREIDNAGHEIACHSYYHRLVYNLSPREFRDETLKSKDLLENIIGKKIIGYRAPSYSITKKSLWAFDILEELGFKYDSSIFPIYHDRYGIPDSPRFMYKLPDHDLIEIPISTSLLGGRKIPISGGGYFRLFPYFFTKMLLKRINVKENQSFNFYLHPWEFDPEQPRINNITMFSKFRHYINLDKTHDRFIKLINDFKFTTMGTVISKGHE